jgi:hypothetical protein
MHFDADGVPDFRPGFHRETSPGEKNQIVDFGGKTRISRDGRVQEYESDYACLEIGQLMCCCWIEWLEGHNRKQKDAKENSFASIQRPEI